ncbi:MAG: hypothetical protein AAF431_04040 [Pseudomonadota bacterium]
MATLHAFPAIDPGEPKADLIAAEFAGVESASHCDTLLTSLEDQSGASSCEIFCAAMAQVNTDDDVLISQLKIPSKNEPTLRPDFNSRQTEVEPQPPK